MNKKLSPLEAFNYIKRFTYFQDGCYKNELDAIETALKENERLKTSYLENLLNEESKEYIYKKLKALEIIKEKRVDITFFDTYIKWNWEKYQNRKLKCSEKELTKEEFDLLKEVLS